MNWCVPLVLAVALSGCFSSPDEARRVLRQEGYTEVEVTGLAPLSCGHGDKMRTGFKAKNIAGNHVEGVVCCGLVFKACTVRVR